MSLEEINKLIAESQSWQFKEDGRVPPNIDCQGFVLLVLKRYKIVPESFNPLTPMDWKPFIRPIGKAESMCIVSMDNADGEHHIGIAVDKFSVLHFTRNKLCLDRIYDSRFIKCVKGFYKID